jgi:hypothetical protein
MGAMAPNLRGDPDSLNRNAARAFGATAAMEIDHDQKIREARSRAPHLAAYL